MRPYICSGKRAASASEADETSGEGKARRTSLGPPIYLGPPVQVSIISSGSVAPAVEIAKAGDPRLPRPRPDRPGFQSSGVANAFAPRPSDPEDPLAAVIDATRSGGPPALHLNGN
jgi:hypothetical protein